MNVLLINDNPAISRLISLSMKKFDYKFTEVNSVQDAFACDILIIDSSFEFDESFESLASNIILILPKNYDKQKYENINARILVKPFLPTDFVDMIKNLNPDGLIKDTSKPEQSKDISSSISSDSFSDLGDIGFDELGDDFGSLDDGFGDLDDSFGSLDNEFNEDDISSDQAVKDDVNSDDLDLSSEDMLGIDDEISIDDLSTKEDEDIDLDDILAGDDNIEDDEQTSEEDTQELENIQDVEDIVGDIEDTTDDSFDIQTSDITEEDIQEISEEINENDIGLEEDIKEDKSLEDTFDLEEDILDGLDGIDSIDQDSEEDIQELENTQDIKDAQELEDTIDDIEDIADDSFDVQTSDITDENVLDEEMSSDGLDEFVVNEDNLEKFENYENMEDIKNDFKDLLEDDEQTSEEDTQELENIQDVEDIVGDIEDTTDDSFDIQTSDITEEDVQEISEEINENDIGLEEDIKEDESLEDTFDLEEDILDGLDGIDSIDQDSEEDIQELENTQDIKDAQELENIQDVEDIADDSFDVQTSDITDENVLDEEQIDKDIKIDIEDEQDMIQTSDVCDDADFSSINSIDDIDEDCMKYVLGEASEYSLGGACEDKQEDVDCDMVSESDIVNSSNNTICVDGSSQNLDNLAKNISDALSGIDKSLLKDINISINIHFKD